MNIKETIFLILIYLVIIFITLWSQGYINFNESKKLSKKELIIMSEKVKNLENKRTQDIKNKK